MNLHCQYEDKPCYCKLLLPQDRVQPSLPYLNPPVIFGNSKKAVAEVSKTKLQVTDFVMNSPPAYSSSI